MWKIPNLPSFVHQVSTKTSAEFREPDCLTSMARFDLVNVDIWISTWKMTLAVWITFPTLPRLSSFDIGIPRYGSWNGVHYPPSVGENLSSNLNYLCLNLLDVQLISSILSFFKENNLILEEKFLATYHNMTLNNSYKIIQTTWDNLIVTQEKEIIYEKHKTWKIE
jgi:hypothetical protein